MIILCTDPNASSFSGNPTQRQVSWSYRVYKGNPSFAHPWRSKKHFLRGIYPNVLRYTERGDWKQIQPDFRDLSFIRTCFTLFFSKTIKGGASGFNKFSQLPRWQKINKCLMSREKAKRVLLVLTLLLLSWDLPKEVKTLLPEQVWGCPMRQCSCFMYNISSVVEYCLNYVKICCIC